MAMKVAYKPTVAMKKHGFFGLRKKPGIYCEQLDLVDNIRLSVALKTVVVGRRCPFLTREGCSIFERRPELCKKCEYLISELIISEEDD